jgi:hypothetical protein
VTNDRIRPWLHNPRYWQYLGQPTLLLGGAQGVSLFQVPDLEHHLDLLAACGGNYVRNTMSSREPGHVWPFARALDGVRYDLERSGDEYWRRFRELLRLAHERRVIVQIELWDRFDHYREPWLASPFNPANNVNYTAEESGLVEDYPVHPAANANPFFVTVPGAEHNLVVLRHQERFVDWVLAETLRYDNVLYCMDNETKGVAEWGAYWSGYVTERAARAGVEVETTEMWDPWDLSDPMHRRTIDHPELYTFVDVSQNNQQRGQTHWDNLQHARRLVETAGRPRPVTNIKIYGADAGPYGSDQDGVERFWRNIFGGSAAACFHRPPAGHGLAEIGQRHLRSARMFADAVPVWRAEPRDDLVANDGDMPSYCLAQAGAFAGVLIPGGGRARFDGSAFDRDAVMVRWLDIERSAWLAPHRAQLTGTYLELVPPVPTMAVALVQP